LVESRQCLKSVTQPIEIAVVFAIWGEHNRLRPRSPDNPNGEDALRIKLQQLAWLTAGTPVAWRGVRGRRRRSPWQRRTCGEHRSR
jgi:hypothetical protein